MKIPNCTDHISSIPHVKPQLIVNYTNNVRNKHHIFGSKKNVYFKKQKKTNKTKNCVQFSQACRHGLVHHLEHLLFYGADMDGRNASGNTSLHVCAVNNQEACARMLLFRGAERAALNYANQTPYQVH